MFIASAEIELLLPGSYSLKDRRQVLQSMLERLRHRFNIAAAEVGGEELWNRAAIGLAVVSKDSRHAQSVLENAVRFVEGDGRCEIIQREIRLI